MYDTNEDILVTRKSDYLNSNIGDGYFIVSKEEWVVKMMGLTVFIYFFTAVPFRNHRSQKGSDITNHHTFISGPFCLESVTLFERKLFCLCFLHTSFKNE